MQEKQFLTKAKFGKLVERTVLENNSSYMDAIIHLCEQYEVELEEVRKFVTPIIKNKIEAEARALHFLPKHNTLPID